jgi:hypothetical protein
MSFIQTTNPVGRRQHTCYLCGRPIPKGEQHRKHVGTYDGDFYSMRNHISCDEKTNGWATEDWEGHDPYEFRKYELGEQV